jgi:O-antigen/teichoic acid export membrane protein
MDKKRFFINLISNFLSALSGIGISFFLTPYIVETLGKEAYGFFPLSNNFIMYAGIITTALNSMSGRFITISLEQKDIKKVNVYFNSVLFGNIIISLFFILISVLFYFFIDKILNIPVNLLADVRLLFMLMFISLIIGVSSSIFSVAAFALNRLDKLAINNIIVNVLKLVVIIAMFYFFTPKIYFLGVSAVATSIYFFYANYKITKKILPEVYISTSMFSWSALTLLVGSGIWNSVLALSNVINSQLDLFIANKFFQASGMGMLSLTKVVPSAVQILCSIIVPVFLPEMIKAYARNDLGKLKNILTFSFKVIFLVVMVPLAVFFVYGDDFFRLWLPGEDHKTLYYISVITLIPFIIHATIETIHHVFVITNKLKIASFWGIFIAFFNFTLVILLCSYSNLGIYSIPIGALIAGGISHLFFTPLYASFCLQESKWYFMKKIVNGLLSFMVLTGIAYLWKIANLITVTSWITFFINTLIIGCVLFAITLWVKFDKATLIEIFIKIRQRVSL